jgi:N-acetylneuraminic acid mutarotase/archaellum component FlaC
MMAGMETKMANLDTNQADMRTKLTNTNTKLTTMDTKMANIISTEMADVKTKMAHTDTKLENLDTKLKNVDTKVTKIDTKMANLQANVEAKFEAVNNEVRGIKMSLNEVKDGFHQLKEAVLEKIESKERKQEEISRNVSGTASGGRENQHIFVAGGAGRNSVEIFNCRQRLWSLLKPMPVKRDDASSFVYNDHVTLAGGECNHAVVDNMIQMKIRRIPDLSINWSDFGAKLPVKLFAHSSVVYKDSLFVTGGYNADNIVSDCIYEVQLKAPYAVKLVSKLPEPRACHSTVLCDDSILIVGGKKSEDCKDILSSVLSYDIKKNECQQLPALPYPVCEMATVKWAENVVIIGGADKDDNALNDVIIYNLKTGHSHMLPPMLHKRTGCMAVVIENTIIVLGGQGLKSVEGFSFQSYLWEELPDMKESRWLATAVVI